MIVKPFRGLRPRSDLATKIPSVPYDVVNTDEARRLAGDDPYSFLHVIRAEIDLDPEMDPFDRRVYAQGGARFRSMIDQGWLVRDSMPAYYVYRLQVGNHTQTPMRFEPTLPPCQRPGVVRHAALESKHETRVATRFVAPMGFEPTLPP